MEKIAITDLRKCPERWVKQKYAKAVRAIQLNVRTAGIALANEEAINAVPYPAFDLGTYARSFKMVPTPDGAMLVNTQKYAGVLERGRRAGKMPPVDALVPWVERKGFVTMRRARVSAARVAARPILAQLAAEKNWKRDNAIRRIAYAIALKQKQFGTKGRFIIKKAAARLLPLLRVAVREALRAP